MEKPGVQTTAHEGEARSKQYLNGLRSCYWLVEYESFTILYKKERKEQAYIWLPSHRDQARECQQSLSMVRGQDKLKPKISSYELVQ